MVNFNIIEGNPNDCYDEYVECYNKGYTIKEIMDKLNISRSTQNSYYKWAKHEGLLNLKRRASPRYYYYSKYYRRWIVQKKNKNVSLVKILCNTEEEAQIIVERMKKHNWSKTEAKKIRDTLRCGGRL